MSNYVEIGLETLERLRELSEHVEELLEGRKFKDSEFMSYMIRYALRKVQADPARFVEEANADPQLRMYLRESAAAKQAAAPAAEEPKQEDLQDDDPAERRTTQ
jgi:hypothetical protein